MKWLILLTLIACGKYNEPSKQDLFDSDGDHIPNSWERGSFKYISHVEKLGKVSGVLRFAHESGVLEVPFTNQLDPHHSLQLLLHREERIKGEEFFNEWSRLRFVVPKSWPKAAGQNRFQLSFASGSDTPEEVLLVSEKGTTVVEKWSKKLEFVLNEDDFNMLIEGKSYLSLRKKVSSEEKLNAIKEKTKRIYYFDGEHSSILYVSKEITFGNLLEHMGIQEVLSVSPERLFFEGKTVDGSGWFARHLSNGDSVLANSSFEELRKEMLRLYTYKKETITRVDGRPQAVLKLNNKKGAIVFLRINKFFNTERSFGESSEFIWHSVNWGQERHVAKCEHFNRAINGEKTYLPGWGELMAATSFGGLLQNSAAIEHIGENNLYWEIKLESPPESLELTALPRAQDTYVTTGEYHNSCRNLSPRRKRPAYSTNIEGILSFEVESFVENME